MGGGAEELKVIIQFEFALQALERTEENNCIVDWILEAEQRARELDLLPAEERGPLHGLPVSIKAGIYSYIHSSIQ